MPQSLPQGPPQANLSTRDPKRPVRTPWLPRDPRTNSVETRQNHPQMPPTPPPPCELLDQSCGPAGQQSQGNVKAIPSFLLRKESSLEHSCRLAPASLRLMLAFLLGDTGVQKGPPAHSSVSGAVSALGLLLSQLSCKAGRDPGQEARLGTRRATPIHLPTLQPPSSIIHCVEGVNPFYLPLGGVTQAGLYHLDQGSCIPFSLPIQEFGKPLVIISFSNVTLRPLLTFPATLAHQTCCVFSTLG